MIYNNYLILGWLGMVFFILAYFLLSIKKLNSNSKLYHLLNLLGSIGIVISTLYTKSWPAMTLNIFWGIIAIFSIYKIINTKPKYKQIRG